MDTKRLLELLLLPTAPFREGHVVSWIRNLLEKKGAPYHMDPLGNIVLGVDSKKAYLQLVNRPSKDPLFFFMAHMDHPGFHGISWQGKNILNVKWKGGAPCLHLKGAKVWLSDKSGYVGKGVIVDFKLVSSRHTIDFAKVKVVEASRPFASLDAKQLFGAFQFKKHAWRKGDLIYTKSADDLVGVFSILTAYLELRKKRKTKPFLGLLTRAEEVGFMGALGHFELGWLERCKPRIIFVSFETSRTLPGAEIGQGPVVRLGDRATVFDPGSIEVFSQVARKVLKKYQRRIMDGGTCEATAANVYGFKTLGISIPLGNYHNQSFEGGTGSRGHLGPAPEFVHLRDVEGQIKLAKALLSYEFPWNEPWKIRKKNLNVPLAVRLLTDSLRWVSHRSFISKS